MAQILGFSTSGKPVLPNQAQNTGTTVDPNSTVIGRRDKLGWENIAENSAKIVSFIGKRFMTLQGMKLMHAPLKISLVMRFEPVFPSSPNFI